MATRTVANSGGNYNSVGTWVEGAIPTSADDVVFTATSGPLTINVASNCKSINFTNYVGTITLNATFIIKGNINLGTGGYLVGGGNTMYAAATGIITSNGTAWKGNFGFLGTSQTYTLADDLTVNGTITMIATAATLNGFTIYVKSTYSHISTGNLIGTTNLVFNGTGVWSHTSSGYLGLNTTINTSGTITCGANVRYNTGILTYTAGTIITTSSTLTIGGACTLDTSGMTWGTILVNGGVTTLLSTLKANRIQNNGFTTMTFVGAFGFEVNEFALTTSFNITVTLVNGVRYLVKQSLITNTPGFTRLFTCASGAALFDLQYGATQNVANTSATGINSLGGQTIYTTSGTLTSTQNWNVGTYRNPTNFMIIF